MKVVTMNLEEDFPPADLAAADLEIAIKNYTGSEVKIIKVIHGYGSHGTGGEIKIAVQDLLYRLKRQNKIKGYVKGEMWGKEAMEAYNIVIDFPELILDKDLHGYNSGVTVVFLN